MRCNIKPKGYNVFQARIYTITDELCVKKAFMNKSKAIQYILEYFKKDRDGQLYARGVIRTIDPVFRVWIVPWSIDNPDAALIDINNAAFNLWKTTFYDMSDTVILSKAYDKDVSEEQLELQMKALNAFYVVVSCHEIGMPERFVIARTIRNRNFRLSFLNYNPESSKLKPGETLEQRYQSLIDEDEAETERINSMRARQIQEKFD